MSANGTSLKSDVVEFIPNTPVLLAIKYPQPKIVQGRYGDRAMFSLTDGRVCFLDLGVAEKVVGIGARTGEPFWINCKWDGKKTSPRVWEVWLDVNAEKTRAAGEHPGYQPKSPAVDPFAAARNGIKHAVERTLGRQEDGTFAVPATPAPTLPADETEWQLRKSAEVEQLKRKLGVDSPEAQSLDTPWAAAIKQRTQASLAMYRDLCQWAQDNMPGVSKMEIRAFLMNSLISAEKGGKR